MCWDERPVYFRVSVCGRFLPSTKNYFQAISQAKRPSVLGKLAIMSIRLGGYIHGVEISPALVVLNRTGDHYFQEDYIRKYISMKNFFRPRFPPGICTGFNRQARCNMRVEPGVFLAVPSSKDLETF